MPGEHGPSPEEMEAINLLKNNGGEQLQIPLPNPSSAAAPQQVLRRQRPQSDASVSNNAQTKIQEGDMTATGGGGNAKVVVFEICGCATATGGVAVAISCAPFWSHLVLIGIGYIILTYCVSGNWSALSNPQRHNRLLMAVAAAVMLGGVAVSNTILTKPAGQPQAQTSLLPEAPKSGNR